MSGAVAATVLCLNSGSSSIKAALLRPDPQGAPGAERRVAEAAVEGIGTGQAQAWVRGPDETEPRDRPVGAAADHAAAVDVVLDLMAGVFGGPPASIAHRVVHGGSQHVGPARVDAALLASLTTIIPLAPLHQPAALAGMRATLRRWPGVPQVACFDTAFHATLPEIARRLPLPEAVVGDEVRRYGFHGLSYAIRKAIGAFAVAMGGLDLLVFTGGIGAHAAPVRAEACAGLEAVGVRIDLAANQRGATRISSLDSPCAVRVVVADEESAMAREAMALLRS